MRTFGEFYDAVFQWADECGFSEAILFLEKWRDTIPEEHWEGLRARMLDYDLFYIFASGVTDMFPITLSDHQPNVLFAQGVTNIAAYFGVTPSNPAV